jgi:predicted N-acyltransferase
MFDHGWADAYARAGGSYYPKLQASVPFTPATGPRLLVRRARQSACANTSRPD